MALAKKIKKSRQKGGSVKAHRRPTDLPKKVIHKGLDNTPDPYQKKIVWTKLPFSGFLPIKNGSQRFTSYKE